MRPTTKLATVLVVLAAAALVATAAATLQEPPQAEPTDEHRWLQQLVGEWDVSMETTMAPDTPPMTMESEESSRMIGDLWYVAEGLFDWDTGSMTSMMTVGYDPEEDAFVGTWIDSTGTHLWEYRGELDAESDTLTLEAEGPRFDGGEGTAVYRDAIRVVGPDEKVLTSSKQNDDGSWTTFMTATYTRVEDGE